MRMRRGERISKEKSSPNTDTGKLGRAVPAASAPDGGCFGAAGFTGSRSAAR